MAPATEKSYGKVGICWQLIMAGRKFLTNSQILWQRVMANTLTSKKF
jgi:hypothetical protein